ncbi:MAG: alpha/beta fold hydrolase, partial [Planctomycetota bacterium]|nr:alpha/beta fold hydrolase [Planctomycetota bacterium]
MPELPASSSSPEPLQPRLDGFFVREWRPEGGRIRGAFLLLHGMESHSGWFADLAPRLTADGWAVFAPDQPGWGQSPGRRGHLGGYRDLLERISGLASELRESHGRLHLAGMSWGGLAALYAALRRGWLFDSLALLAPGIFSRRDLAPASRLLAAGAILAGRRDILLNPVFRPEDFTSRPEWREFIRTDAERTRRVDASFCLETLKMRRFVRETAGKRRLPPALCLLAGRDRIIDNQAVAALCRRAGIQVEALPDAAHSLIFENPAATAGFLARQAAAREASGNPAPTRPTWLVGPGAVGGALASLLSFGRQPTGLLSRPGRSGRLRGGFRLQAGSAWRQSAGALVYAETAAALPPRPALVILAVKSFSLPAALAALAGKIPADAAIAAIGNGVLSEAAIAKSFPRHSVIAAVLCAGLETLAPGVVSWPDDRGGLAAAMYQGDAELAREAWQGAMTATGMESHWFAGPRAAERLKWSKLMLNAGFNALNALTGWSSAGILRQPDCGKLAVRAMREGFQVMRALSLAPVDLPGFQVARLGLLLRLPPSLARALLARRPAPEREAAFSMRQDFLKRRG